MTLALAAAARRGRRARVEVYTRDRCGLCARAEALVAEEAGRAEVRRIDIDTSDDLQRRYGVRVPVVVVDGREVAEGRLEPGVVRRALLWTRWRRRS